MLQVLSHAHTQRAQLTVIKRRKRVEWLPEGMERTDSRGGERNEKGRAVLDENNAIWRPWEIGRESGVLGPVRDQAKKPIKYWGNKAGRKIPGVDLQRKGGFITFSYGIETRCATMR